MANTGLDQQRHHQLLHQRQGKQRHPQRGPADSTWNSIADKLPSTPQLVVLVVLLPLGSTLLLLAGPTLAASMVCIPIAVPLLLPFSPIIVPAVVTVVPAVIGILASRAFGVTVLASVLWLANYVRAVRPRQEADAYLGHRADKLGLNIEHNAHEDGRSHEGTRT